MHNETKCVHSGKYRDSTTRGITSPIFTSSSYEYLDREESLYPRYFNLPNQEAVVQKLCALEGAESGVLLCPPAWQPSAPPSSPSRKQGTTWSFSTGFMGARLP